METGIKLIAKEKTEEQAKQCPQGHGKMKKSYGGTWFCINCQRYYE